MERIFSLQFVGLFLLCADLRVGALECYSCIHSSYLDCSQPNIHALRVMSCPSAFTRCTKLIRNATSNIISVERSCGPPDVCGTVKEFLDDVLECYTCERNLCNSSSTPVTSWLVFTLILTLVLRNLIK